MAADKIQVRGQSFCGQDRGREKRMRMREDEGGGRVEEGRGKMRERVGRD
jgi:hypothetical protein